MKDISGNYKDFNKSTKVNAEMYSRADRDNTRDCSDVNIDHNNNNKNNKYYYNNSESSKNVAKSKMS